MAFHDVSRRRFFAFCILLRIPAANYESNLSSQKMCQLWLFLFFHKFIIVFFSFKFILFCQFLMAFHDASRRRFFAFCILLRIPGANYESNLSSPKMCQLWLFLFFHKFMVVLCHLISYFSVNFLWRFTTYLGAAFLLSAYCSGYPQLTLSQIWVLQKCANMIKTSMTWLANFPNFFKNLAYLSVQ